MKRNLLPSLLAALLAAGVPLAQANEGHHASTATATAGAGHGDAAEHDHNDAIGVEGVAANVTRTVNVDMTDAMRFNPSDVRVKQGETVRFAVKNSGQIRHEFVLGTVEELKEHYEAMKKFPEMEHAEPNMVTLAPGKTGEVIWQFTKAGKVDFACLQPGHYDAGMKGVVKVAAGKGTPKKADSRTDHKH